MRLSTLLTIVIVHVQASNVIYKISNVNIDAGRKIYTLFPASANCIDGAELKYQFYPRVETSGLYIDQKSMGDSYSNASVTYVNFTTIASFSMPSANTYTLSGTVFFTCRGVQIVDYLVLRVEDVNTYNDTWPTSITGSTPSSNYGLIVTISFDRSCDNWGMFGLRCDEPTSDTKNDQYCYYYDARTGAKVCCDNPYINPVNCAWNNATCSVFDTSTSTPSWCPDVCPHSDDKGKENLYFWLMIGFVILSGILILLLLFLLCLLCLRKDNKQTVAPAPVYVQPVRTEVIPSRRPSERRTRARSREAPPYPSYRNSPTRRPRDDIRGSYQLEYDVDDDSLRNEWVEPMPRRVAKQTSDGRRSTPREPQDAVV